jgi:hypothetical protein
MRSEDEIREMISDLQSQIKQCDNFDDKIKGIHFIQALEYVLQEDNQ